MKKDGPCEHVASIEGEVRPHARGCEECLAMGDSWVHLRLCLSCGHVGCCDASKNKHATKHFRATAHPVDPLAGAGRELGLVLRRRSGLRDRLSSPQAG